MDRNDLAAFLALAAGMYQRQAILALDPSTRGERCRQLNSYGILSLSAIGEVLGCSTYQVEKSIIGMQKPTSRGRLNPQHLSMLAYSLSTGRINDVWLGILLEEGTSLSTISDLTGIAESTLYRHKGRINID
jgi:hypothetical protein